MPSGVNLSREMKDLLVFQRRVLNYSIQAIHSNLFQNDGANFSVSRLQYLCRMSDANGSEWNFLFLGDAVKKSGRKRSMTYDERHIVLSMLDC